MRIDTVDIRLLRVFLAIADHGGFAGAQLELGLSPSTLSIHLSNLESRLGVTLCHRGRRGFALTEKGVLVRDSARRLFMAVETFRAEAGTLRDKLIGDLSLGVVDATVTDPRAPLTEAIRRFAARDAEVHVSMTVDRPAGLIRALLDDRLHLAIGAFPRSVSGVTFQPLYDEDHSLYCAPGHALFARPDGAIGFDEVAAQRLVGRGYDLERDLMAVGAATHAATVENMEAQATLILSGAYIGFLPDHYAATWVAGGHLRSLRPEHYRQTVPLALARRSDRRPTAVLSKFLEDLTAANKNFE